MVEPVLHHGVFAVGYLALYPGLIVFPGALGWSTDSLYKDEVAGQGRVRSDLRRVRETGRQTVAPTRAQLQIGGRLFQTYCVQCHGTDMRGSKGFPNLVDGDWLYAGTPEASSRPSWMVATA